MASSCYNSCVTFVSLFVKAPKEDKVGEMYEVRQGRCTRSETDAKES